VTLRLPRIQNNTPIVDSRGYVTLTFQLWWQNAMEQIETAINGVQSALDAAAAADAAAANADAAAVAAQTAADTAQGVADQVAADSSLANSYTTGLTIDATDVGASVTIAMSAHTRVYGDGTSVAVSAGNITGLAYSTSYWVGYVDAARTGGAVTYTSSTSIQGNGTAANYHFVGAVVTPAAAGPPETGVPVLPPGANIP